MTDEEMKEETCGEEAPENETNAVKPEENETVFEADEPETNEKPEENEKEDAEEVNPEKKKKFFGKKEKKELQEKEAKIEELTDRCQRLMAEFDNYRKRTDKEKSSMFDMGTTTTVEKILPVVDNLERGLQSIPEEGRDNAVYQGMDQIYKQLVKILTDMGVEPMNAAGKEFDPNLHNAVMQVESDTLEENTVADELQKGYLYKNQVIRHAMVSVVKKN